MVLYCKNKAIYDIDKEKVINKDLLPGLMRKNPCSYTFKHWLKLRYSTNTNSLARRLKGITFGQGNRVTINKHTHILSLSDCYWVKDKSDDLLFEDVSPYYNDFWKGEGIYKKDTAIPTLYVGGYLPKEWVSSKFLNKYGSDIEIEEAVSNLCKICSIPVCSIKKIENGIQVENFTNPKLMLEQADQSGIIDPDDFTELDIVNYMGISGIQMLTIDAIVGNGDRHAGNFGWLRDTDTGRYIIPAPLYDFDHALDSKLPCDRLIKDTIKVANMGYQGEVARICKIVIALNTNNIFKLRAGKMLELLR